MKRREENEITAKRDVAISGGTTRECQSGSQPDLSRGSDVKKTHDLYAEESIPLRLSCAGMSLLSILAACYYTNTPAPVMWAYVIAALAGTYIGYRFRQTRNFWIVSLAIVGTFAVIGLFATELLTQLTKDKLINVVPFIHVVTGLIVLHTFDLRSRADINISCLIALGLFSLTAIIARDGVFGLYSCLFICLGAVLLYQECRLRSYESAQGSKTGLKNTVVRSNALSGNAILFVSTLPLISFILFLSMPRVNSLIDLLLEAIRRVQVAPHIQVPKSSLSNFHNPASRSSLKEDGRESRNNSPSSFEEGNKTYKRTGRTGKPSTDDGIATVHGRNLREHSFNRAGKQSKSSNGSKQAVKKQDNSYFREGDEDKLVFKKRGSGYDDNKLLLTIFTPRKLYIKRLSLDTYDGHYWFKSHPGKQATCEKLGGTYQELGGVPSLYLPSTLRTIEVVQNITVEADLGKVIPVAWTPARIAYPEDLITVDNYGMLKAEHNLIKGISYTVISELPVLSQEELRQSALPTAQALMDIRNELSQYLQLPPIVTAEVKRLANEKAKGGGNWFVQAERLSDYLRTNYEYLSNSASSEANYELVHHFLFIKKRGNCGEYASALAVMCRLNGIPARCVAGFTPGELNPLTGLWEIKAKHCHAWVEVFLPEVGWLALDPTPTEGEPTLGFQTSSIGVFLRDHFGLFFGQKSNAQKNKRSGFTQISSDKPKFSHWLTFKLGTFWETWQRIILVIVAVPVSFLLFESLSVGFKRLKTKRNNLKDDNINPSTEIYLKVLEDLKTLKISRLPSDTSEDVSAKVTNLAEKPIDEGPPMDPELSSVIKHFMEIYSVNRFGHEGEKHEPDSQLQEIGSTIHSMVKARDKSPFRQTAGNAASNRD